MSAAASPSSSAAISIPTASHRRASSTVSCGFPRRRFPTPFTSASAFARTHRFVTAQPRNVFASASVFRAESTDIVCPRFVLP
jgi:hypothetical protein